jgi:hypothetical protein
LTDQIFLAKLVNLCKKGIKLYISPWILLSLSPFILSMLVCKEQRKLIQTSNPPPSKLQLSSRPVGRSENLRGQVRIQGLLKELFFTKIWGGGENSPLCTPSSDGPELYVLDLESWSSLPPPPLFVCIFSWATIILSTRKVTICSRMDTIIHP